MKPKHPPLAGTLTPPAVELGQVVYDRFFRRKCRVVRWREAPIRWPLVRPANQGGRPSPWMNADLERAVRAEPPTTLARWFGVTPGTAIRWRERLGVAWQAEQSERTAASSLGVDGSTQYKKNARTGESGRAKKAKGENSFTMRGPPVAAARGSQPEREP